MCVCVPFACSTTAMVLTWSVSTVAMKQIQLRLHACYSIVARFTYHLFLPWQCWHFLLLSLVLLVFLMRMCCVFQTFDAWLSSTINWCQTKHAGILMRTKRKTTPTNSHSQRNELWKRHTTMMIDRLSFKLRNNIDGNLIAKLYITRCTLYIEQRLHVCRTYTM